MPTYSRGDDLKDSGIVRKFDPEVNTTLDLSRLSLLIPLLKGKINETTDSERKNQLARILNGVFVLGDMIQMSTPIKIKDVGFLRTSLQKLGIDAQTYL